jgi:hypothetical protein
MKKAQRNAWIALPAAILVGAGVAWAGSQGSVRFLGVPLFALCVGLAFLLHWIAFVPAYLLRTASFYGLTGSLTTVSVIVLALLAGGELNDGMVGIAYIVVIWAAWQGYFSLRRGRPLYDVEASFLRILSLWTLQGLWVTLALAATLAAITITDPFVFGLPALLGLPISLVGWFFDGFLPEILSYPKPAAGSRPPGSFGEILFWVGVGVVSLSELQGWQSLFVVLPLTGLAFRPEWIRARLDDARHPPPLSDRESIWEQPAGPLLQSWRGYVVTAAAALFGALFALDVALPRWAPKGGLVLYVLPIVLLSLLSGLRLGLAAGALATGLAVLGGLIQGGPFGPVSYAWYGVVFLALGGTGLYRDAPIRQLLLAPAAVVAAVGELIHQATAAFAGGAFLGSGSASSEPQVVYEMRLEVYDEQLSSVDAVCLALAGELPDKYRLTDGHQFDQSLYRGALGRLNAYVSDLTGEDIDSAFLVEDLEEGVRSGEVDPVHVVRAVDASGAYDGLLTIFTVRCFEVLHEQTEGFGDLLEKMLEELESERKRRRRKRGEGAPGADP